METYNFMMDGRHLQQIAQLGNISDDATTNEDMDNSLKPIENNENDQVLEMTAQMCNDFNESAFIVNTNFRTRGLKRSLSYDSEPKCTDKRNERERKRVKTVNWHFAALQEHVPKTLNRNGKAKKMSKVDILRAAVDYIHHLQDILQSDDVAGRSSEQLAFTSATTTHAEGTFKQDSIAQNYAHTTEFATLQSVIDNYNENRSFSPSSFTSGSSVTSPLEDIGYGTDSASGYSQGTNENLTSLGEDTALLDIGTWFK